MDKVQRILYVRLLKGYFNREDAHFPGAYPTLKKQTVIEYYNKLQQNPDKNVNYVVNDLLNFINKYKTC